MPARWMRAWTHVLVPAGSLAWVTQSQLAPPPPPIFALPAQHPIHHTPPPPPTQPMPSAVGWTPTHPPPGSFGSPTFHLHRRQRASRHLCSITHPLRVRSPRRCLTDLHYRAKQRHPRAWDAKVWAKLLRRVASTPYSQKAGISGCPIEQAPALAIIRHGWSSYWSKSIADAVLASELLSMIRQRKINTDAAAAAYAWEHSLPMDRTSAVKALAEDFCDYMEDLIHKKQVARNASNSAQHTMGTPAAVQAASQGIDPASSHRITQLEVQLAKAQHTIKHLQANASGQANPGPNQRPAETTATRGRTIQEQIDRLTQEVGPPEPILPQVTEQDVAEVAESIPASQDTVIFSPSGRPLLDQDEPSPANTPFNPKRKLTFSSPGNTQPTSGAAASTQGTETSASTRPPTKRLRQATLTGKPTPAARQAGEIFNTPTQPSAWFTANYTGVHTESGIARWFGGLKIPDKKKNEVRQYIETVMTQFPSISEEQRSNLDRHAAAQGIAVRAVAKFADAPLMKLLSIITAMSE